VVTHTDNTEEHKEISLGAFLEAAFDRISFEGREKLRKRIGLSQPLAAGSDPCWKAET
jgi:hypothetical protein